MIFIIIISKTNLGAFFFSTLGIFCQGGNRRAPVVTLELSAVGSCLKIQAEIADINNPRR